MDGLQNGPAISLFQGSGSLEINTNDQEEEEAIADKRRMDQELQNLLTNAFDDLDDDDDDDDDDQSTINSSLHLGSSHHDEDENYNASYSDGSGGEYNAGQHDVSSSQHNNSLPNNRSQSPTAARALEEYMNRRNLAENRILADDSHAGGDASVSMLHYQHCVRTGSVGFTFAEDQHNDKQPTGSEGYASTEQLQVLYEVRVREVRRLAQQLEAFEHEKDQLLRKVALREAEKEHAHILYKQAQGLLVEHKERIRELEKQVEELQATVASLEKSKSELSHQLEVSQASVMDLHSKISLLERANFNNTDKHMDAFLRNVQASHSKELKKLENQLESTATKLSKKEYELEQVQKHSEELARKHEALMVEKAETINQLSRNLEESQRQCQQLMGSAVSEEVIRLRVQLENALKDKELLENQKQDLQKELEALRMDIQQYDAIAKLGLFRPDESVDEADSIVQLGIGNRNRENGSGGIPHLADLNAKLRSELQRCLIGQRLKREEISRLKAQLTNREQSVAALQKQEAQYLVAVEKLKAEYVVLIEELNSHRELAKKSMAQNQKDEKAETVMKEALRAEFEASLNSAKEECTRQANLNEQLQQEIKRLQKLMDEDKKETINRYSEEYLKFHDRAVAQVKQERDREHEAVVSALRYELEDARKEVDRVKELYIKVCGSKEELLLTLQQERKASEELKSQLEKLKAEMQAYDEAERTRAVRHEAALLKMNSEKEKLESERRSVVEVQTLQQELEKERAQYETAMLKIQEDRKKLEAERETLGNIHSLQQELEKEKAQQKAALLKLGEERSKLESERRALGEIQDFKLLLEREKDQHKATLAKLEEERGKLQNLQTSQHQLEELKTQLETNVSNLSAEKAKTEALHNELKAERNRLNELKIHYENEIESMTKEHKRALLEMEEKARNLYAKRVTEEIEKAKRETLAELERNWSRKHEEKEANRQDSSTSPIKNIGNMDVERLRKELTAAFHGQVTELQLKHQAALEQNSERIKNETVRFFAEQIRQLDAKHRVDLQRVQQVHMETVASLRKTLVEEHTKLQHVTGELQKMQQSLEEERNQGPWKVKAEMLSQQVLDAEKISETYRSKYRAAKKTALKYKQYAEAKEKHLNSEWKRINQGFQEALEKVQSRLESLLESKGFLSDAKMVQCSEQIKELQDNHDIK